MPTPSIELRHLINQAGAEPVEFEDPETNTRFVLVRAELFLKMQERLAEEERDRGEHEAWARIARRSRDLWAEENAY
jgi:hypothetical protein